MKRNASLEAIARITAVGFATCLLASAASAQVRMPMQPISRVPMTAAATIDHDALTDRRLISLAKKNRLLEGRVATLESALREMHAANTFTCSAASTSSNGSGASESCSPYACNYLDGRCRTTSVDSTQCAAGFLWDGSNHCVAPPPAAPDDDCGFLGLFC